MQCSLCQKCNILGLSVSKQFFGEILSSLGATAMMAERGFVPSCCGRAPKTRTLSPHSDSAVHHRGSRQDLSCWARHFTGTDRLTHGTFPPVSAPQPMADPKMTCPAFRMTFLYPQSTLVVWPCMRQQYRGGGSCCLMALKICSQITADPAEGKWREGIPFLFASNLAFNLISCSYTLPFDPVPWSLHEELNNSGHPKLQCWEW